MTKFLFSALLFFASFQIQTLACGDRVAAHKAYTCLFDGTRIEVWQDSNFFENSAAILRHETLRIEMPLAEDGIVILPNAAGNRRVRFATRDNTYEFEIHLPAGSPNGRTRVVASLGGDLFECRGEGFRNLH